MAKHKKSRQHSPEPDIFERYGNQLAKAGGIDRLLLFGAPASSNHGSISAGEFVIDPQIEKWLVAIDEAEEGDKSALVALMKSGSLPAVIAPHIGDLIERCYHFKKPGHRPRTPSHRLTDKEIAMNAAGGDKHRGPKRRIQARDYDAKRRAKRRVRGSAGK
jgi:hypothetical protein